MNDTNFSSPRGRDKAAWACDDCHGTTEHEPWCVARDPAVRYAHQIVAEASKLTLADTLILHSLGVAWTAGPARRGDG